VIPSIPFCELRVKGAGNRQIERKTPLRQTPIDFAFDSTIVRPAVEFSRNASLIRNNAYWNGPCVRPRQELERTVLESNILTTTEVVGLLHQHAIAIKQEAPPGLARPDRPVGDPNSRVR
jgi:hypothetical protein